MACFFRFPALKTLYALAALLISTGWAGSAAAEVLLNPSHLCHAVSAKVAPRGTLPPHFSCRGEPEGYQHGSLWLRADLARVAVDPGNLALLVHYSRFDRLEVTFTYLDGREVRQSVRSGDFGTHWRSGGQLHFSAPDRDSPLRYVTMRFDRLASAEMLRMRLLDRDEASLESMILSGWVGATLTLLLAGTVYNVSLAISLRRQFPVWQAGWSMCMFAWGALWSQLHLLIAPGLAGTISAQLCSALACLAITSAALSAITALETHELPRAARYTVLTLACSASLLGMPVAMIRSGPVDTLVAMVGILLILTMLGVAACLA
ncbi:MAG: GGDEF domain-containing protein, partial [Novosphingobium sp.]